MPKNRAMGGVTNVQTYQPPTVEHGTGVERGLVGSSGHCPLHILSNYQFTERIPSPPKKKKEVGWWGTDERVPLGLQGLK